MIKKFFALITLVFNVICIYGAEYPQRRRGHHVQPLTGITVKKKKRTRKARSITMQPEKGIRAQRRVASLPPLRQTQLYTDRKLFTLILNGEIAALDKALITGVDKNGKKIDAQKTKIYFSSLIDIAAAHGTPAALKTLIEHGATPGLQTFERILFSQELTNDNPRRRRRIGLKITTQREAQVEAYNKLVALKNNFPNQAEQWEGELIRLREKLEKTKPKKHRR